MFDGEAAPWLAKESLPILVPVPSAYASLRCSRGGLCVTTIYANGLRRRRHWPGDKCHLDEVFITIHGKTHYL